MNAHVLTWQMIFIIENCVDDVGLREATLQSLKCHRCSSQLCIRISTKLEISQLDAAFTR